MHIYYLYNTFSCLYIKVLYYTVTDTKYADYFAFILSTFFINLF